MQLVEISIGLIIAAICYEYFLRKETFFQYNRLYLILMPLCCFALPFLNVSWQQEEVMPFVKPIIVYPKALQSVVYQPIVSTNFSQNLDLGDIIWAIFLIGFAYKILRLGLHIYQTMCWIKAGQQEKKGAITFVKNEQNLSISSFFNYIFWKENIENQHLILSHELVHVTQRHSIDVILMEILLACQWYNPLMYYFKNRLKEVHEFIADEYVARVSGERYQYAAVLVAEASKMSKPPSSLINTFSSFTKQRLIMLSNPRSLTWKISKYALIFPQILLLFLLFSCNLIAKIPTPLPLVQEYMEKIAAHKIIETPDYQLPTLEIKDTPPPQNNEERFIFYWGNFQMEFLQNKEKPDMYTAEIEVSIDNIKSLVTRGTNLYFWNGKELDRNIQFTLLHFDKEKSNAVEMPWNTAELNNRDAFRDKLYYFAENVKPYDILQIEDLRANSTSGKHLSAVIKVTGSLIMPEKRTVFIPDSVGNFNKKVNTSLDFKWGHIGVKGGKIAKKDLLQSFLSQPVVFNDLGQPVQNTRFSIIMVSGSKSYDPVECNIKSNLTDTKVYEKYRNYLPAVFQRVEEGDRIYIDNIEGKSPDMGEFRFSVVLEVSE